MPLHKKTKIVATLGPASESEEVLEQMILAGTNVFRINFSHADHSDVAKRIQIIRELSEKLNLHISILGDLQGPKLRVGVIEEGAFVNPGDLVDFNTSAPFEGSAKSAYMTYKRFPLDVNLGERILLDDGKLIFEVVSSDRKELVTAKVIQGGPFKSKKGVNLPNTNVSLPALTKKDVDDAIFAIEQKVDWIALSFVRNSEDLIELQDLIKKYSEHKIPIIAKIEKPEAIENIDKIIAYCDGLMVARGDLGVEVPAAEVPLIQKNLVLKAKKAIKLKQKETVKDSEIYNQYEEQLKKLDKEFVSLTNVSKEIQVEDFKDFYDEVVGAGPQLGQDGAGTSLFGNSTVDNFPTYEEYISKYGGTADTYTMLEDLNNINKDAEIAKKLYSEHKYELDEEKRNELFSENKEEIQRLANENDIDYDTLKNYITLGNFGTDVGAEEIGNLFNDRRDLVDDRYDKFMKRQGFARDGWLDDEYIKTVYGDEDPELLEKIQNKFKSDGFIVFRIISSYNWNSLWK